MPSEVTVFLPDGSARSVPAGTTIAELAAGIGRRLAAAAVAAELDGVMVDLSQPLAEGAKVRIITSDSDEGREVLRHSTAHVMAQAVLRLWPGTRYAIGPAIVDGFYYDFDLPKGARFSDDDLARIDAEMKAIIAEAQPFVREEHTIAEGLQIFADQPYKREIIEGCRGGRRPRRRARGRGRRESRRRQHLPQPSGVRGLVPRPPCALHGSPGALQADPGGRRLLARR